jgi:TolB-like protein
MTGARQPTGRRVAAQTRRPPSTEAGQPQAAAWLLAARPTHAAFDACAAGEGGRSVAPGLAAFDGPAPALRAALALRAASLREGGPAPSLSVGWGSAPGPDLGAPPGRIRVTAAAFAEARRFLPSLSARFAALVRRAGEEAGVEALEILDDPRGASAAPVLRPDRAIPPADAALLAPLNAEGGPDALRLALGVTGALAAQLARWRDLAVVAPAAGALLAAEAGDPALAARRLGARWAIAGDLRREADAWLGHVRVMEAATGRIVWSGWRRAEAADLFAVESALAEAIAAAVGLALRAAPPPRGPADARACVLTRRAQGLLASGTREDWARARVALDAALALDPEFAPALAASAEATRSGWRRGWDRDLGPAEAAALAEAATRADPLDAAGWRALGAAALAQGDAQAACRACARAVELNPTDPDARAGLAAALTAAGDADRALVEIATAMRLHPCHPDDYLAVEAAARLTAGDAERAAVAALRMRAPEEARLVLAAALLAASDVRAAGMAAAQARAERPDLDGEGWLRRLALGTREAQALALRALALP